MSRSARRSSRHTGDSRRCRLSSSNASSDASSDASSVGDPDSSDVETELDTELEPEEEPIVERKAELKAEPDVSPVPIKPALTAEQAEELLAEWLMQWEDAVDAGRPVTAEELGASHPELVASLAKRIGDLESLNWLKKKPASSHEGPPLDATQPTIAWKSDWKEGDEPTPGYVLLRLLGHGSFGEVWAVRDPGSVRKALKIVDNPSKLHQERRGLDRMVDVRHPYVLSIERVRFHDGKLMIVTEMAEESLHDLFTRRREKLAWADNRHLAETQLHNDILRLLRDAAEALDYMREYFHLLHLDIKPTNLMLVKGRCKVGDFGTISRLMPNKITPGLLANPADAAEVARQLFERGASGGWSITNSGAFTHNYAPPEAYRGEFSRSHDQYSLAVTYCELLTGRIPFTGDWCEQVHQRANYRMNVDILPVAVRLVVTRALASNPNERYSSCVEFIEELFRALMGATVNDSSMGEAIAAAARALADDSGPRAADNPPAGDSLLTTAKAPPPASPLTPPVALPPGTIECRVLAELLPRPPQPRIEPADMDVTIGSLSILFGEDGLSEQITQTQPLQIPMRRSMVIGRQEGGGTEYLDPNYSPTQRLPGAPRRIVLDSNHGLDRNVSRGHFMLKATPTGLLFINGVPHRNGTIRPPINGTVLLEPQSRAFGPGEEYLIAHGQSIKIRLPNNIKVLIAANAIESSE